MNILPGVKARIEAAHAAQSASKPSSFGAVVQGATAPPVIPAPAKPAAPGMMERRRRPGAVVASRAGTKTLLGG